MTAIPLFFSRLLLVLNIYRNRYYHYEHYLTRDLHQSQLLVHLCVLPTVIILLLVVAATFCAVVVDLLLIIEVGIRLLCYVSSVVTPVFIFICSTRSCFKHQYMYLLRTIGIKRQLTMVLIVCLMFWPISKYTFLDVLCSHLPICH